MHANKIDDVDKKRTKLDIFEEILSAISIVFLVAGLLAFQLLE